MRNAPLVISAYAFVTAFATFLNIGTQAFSMCVYSGVYAIELSVLLATAVCFPIKFILEKKYVFKFKSNASCLQARVFILYGFMSVLTTFIFFGIEFAFHYLYGTSEMRYLGGAVGLSLGSYVKYRLDKRFVFKQE